MLGVDYCRNTACFLRLCYGVDCQSGLTRRFRPENFNYSAAGIASYAERVVQPDGAGWNHFYILHHVVAKFHYGSATEVFLNLIHCLGKGIEFRLCRILFLFSGRFFLFHLCMLFRICFLYVCDAKIMPELGN